MAQNFTSEQRDRYVDWGSRSEYRCKKCGMTGTYPEMFLHTKFCPVQISVQ